MKKQIKPNTDMFYCHNCDKIMMEDPYLDYCLLDNHETEKHNPNKFVKPESYWREIEYYAWERGEMQL